MTQNSDLIEQAILIQKAYRHYRKGKIIIRNLNVPSSFKPTLIVRKLNDIYTVKYNNEIVKKSIYRKYIESIYKRFKRCDHDYNFPSEDSDDEQRNYGHLRLNGSQWKCLNDILDKKSIYKRDIKSVLKSLNSHQINFI